MRISTKASIYNHDLIEIGDHSRIYDFCVVSGRVQLGRNVSLAVFSHVAGGDKGVYLDDYSALAHAAHVFSKSDDYTGEAMFNPTIPIEYRKETSPAEGKLERHLPRALDRTCLR